MLFGPSKKEIWRHLAAELDGQFVKGKVFKKDKVYARHGEWIIVLDTFTRKYGNANKRFTRIRAPYLNRDDFVFQIYRSKAFSGMRSYFGMQDVEVGDPYFDKDFVIQGNDIRKLKMFFKHTEIKDLIMHQPNILLKIREDEDKLFAPPFPKGINEVYFESRGIIKNIEQLHDLFELFALTLDHLHHIGTAWNERPESKI
ncbi:MAG: DUF3137 domain-containing protein [Bacteroidota bacterium]